MNDQVVRKNYNYFQLRPYSVNIFFQLSVNKQRNNAQENDACNVIACEQGSP